MKQLKDGDIIIAKFNTRPRKELYFQLQLRSISITCCKFVISRPLPSINKIYNIILFKTISEDERLILLLSW